MQIPCCLNLDSAVTRPQCLEVAFRLQPQSFHSQPSLQTPHPSTTPRLLPTFPAGSSPGSVLGKAFTGSGARTPLGEDCLGPTSAGGDHSCYNQRATPWDCWTEKAHHRLSGW